MKQEDAESLARGLDKRLANGRHIADHDIRPLVDYILSGDMKREIENAAIAMVADEFFDVFGDKAIVAFIRALIQPPAQKENWE